MIGLIRVKEEGWTGFSEGWQGCSEGIPEGKNWEQKFRYGPPKMYGWIRIGLPKVHGRIRIGLPKVQRKAQLAKWSSLDVQIN